MATKTVNASFATYEVLGAVKRDIQENLQISVTMSEAIQIAATAYFELKDIKKKAKLHDGNDQFQSQH